MLTKLLKVLDCPTNDILLHIDKKAGEIERTNLQNVCHYSKVMFTLKRQNVRWGTEDIVDAEMTLFEEGLNSGTYNRFHLISGSDYPIKSNDYIYHFFDGNSNNYFSWTNNLRPDHYQRLSLYWTHLFKCQV